MHDKSWTHEEIDVCVKDYLHMLTLELNGQKYNNNNKEGAVLDQRLDLAPIT